MDVTILHAFLEFTKPYFAEQDEMHDMGHVQRVLAQARRLAGSKVVDGDLLIFGAHFHGLIYNDEGAIRNFLSSLGFDRDRIMSIMRVALEAGKEASPETTEGGILHDAHLIEGGKEFQVTKTLLTGALRGQSLSQTIDYVETQVVNRFKCVTPQGKAEYAEIEAFHKAFFEQVKERMKYEKLGVEAGASQDSVRPPGNAPGG